MLLWWTRLCDMFIIVIILYHHFILSLWLYMQHNIGITTNIRDWWCYLVFMIVGHSFFSLFFFVFWLYLMLQGMLECVSKKRKRKPTTLSAVYFGTLFGNHISIPCIFNILRVVSFLSCKFELSCFCCCVVRFVYFSFFFHLSASGFFFTLHVLLKSVYMYVLLIGMRDHWKTVLFRIHPYVKLSGCNLIQEIDFFLL